MRPITSPLRTLVLAAAMTVALCGLGCQSGPHDVGLYDSTPADRGSMRASDPDLLRFCDQVAERIVEDLAKLPEIQSATTRKVLALGSIRNVTATPTTDFESILLRLRGRIQASERTRRDFIVIQDPGLTLRDRERFVGETEDLLQEGLCSEINRYSASDTYTLQGELFERKRTGGDATVQRFYFALSLVNLQTNAIVFSNDYDLIQLR